MDERTELDTLLRAYYHEDWQTDGPDVFDPLGAFLAVSSSAEARRLAAQVEQLLDEIPDDTALEDHLDRVGFGVYLGDAPAAYRTWLQEVAARSRVFADGGTQP